MIKTFQPSLRDSSEPRPNPALKRRAIFTRSLRDVITRCTLTVVAVFLVPLLTAMPIQARAAEKALNEKEKIEALIKSIETLKDATFIRNGSDYDAKTAAKFLRSKWGSKEKEVKTAGDFIEKVAGTSSTSGKPYLIRFKDGREVKCAAYLKEELKKLEAATR